MLKSGSWVGWGCGVYPDLCWKLTVGFLHRSGVEGGCQVYLIWAFLGGWVQLAQEGGTGWPQALPGPGARGGPSHAKRCWGGNTMEWGQNENWSAQLRRDWDPFQSEPRRPVVAGCHKCSPRAHWFSLPPATPSRESLALAPLWGSFRAEVAQGFALAEGHRKCPGCEQQSREKATCPGICGTGFAAQEGPGTCAGTGSAAQEGPGVTTGVCRWTWSGHRT